MAHLNMHHHRPDRGALQRRAAKGARPEADGGATRAAHPLIQLQRQLGNRHVQGLIAQRAPISGLPATIQAQGVPLGPDEEKATQAAAEDEEQMAAAEEEEAMAAEEDELQAAEEDELQAAEEDELQAAEEDELQAAEEDELQAAADTGARVQRKPNVSSRIRAQRGGGAPLPAPTLQRMSEAFGQSFDHVRVHTSGEANNLSRDVGAKAFTNQSDIFFRDGRYQPGTTQGDNLIAHELTHVVQQGQGLVPSGHQSAGRPGTGDIFEQEAQATADAVTGNQPLPGTTPATSVQRKAEH